MISLVGVCKGVTYFFPYTKGIFFSDLLSLSFSGPFFMSCFDNPRNFSLAVSGLGSVVFCVNLPYLSGLGEANPKPQLHNFCSMFHN